MCRITAPPGLGYEHTVLFFEGEDENFHKASRIRDRFFFPRAYLIGASLFRLIKNILVLAFLLILPLAVKFYYSSPEQRAYYIAWLQQRSDMPLLESVARVRQEIEQVTAEQLMARFNQSAEGFQQIATCGKTETLAVEEASSSKVYRWVDEAGQVHFSDKEPGKLVNTEQMSVHYPNRKRYFNLKLIEDNASLPAFTRDKVSADMRQIYGILSRDMQLDHLRQVMLNVRLIDSQEAFQAYRAEVAPQISTNSGFYTSKHNEAVVFQSDNEQQTLAVVRHEATHVIVAGLYGYTPVWFNEGLAEYFEHMHISGQLRQVEPVTFHVEHLRQLVNGGQLMPWRDYIQLKPDQWYSGNLQNHYAQAWALVYFLMSEDTGKQLLQGMMNQLAENFCWQFSSVDYIEQSYPGGLAGLEADWRKWLEQEPQPHRY